MGLPNIKQRKKFKQVFGFECMGFFNPNVPELGFDIVKFAGHLMRREGYDENKNGGMSIREFLLEKYPQRAVDLIEEFNAL